MGPSPAEVEGHYQVATEMMVLGLRPFEARPGDAHRERNQSSGERSHAITRKLPCSVRGYCLAGQVTMQPGRTTW